MKRIIISLFLIAISANLYSQKYEWTEWSEWKTISCFTSIDFRVKTRVVNDFDEKTDIYEAYVEFRNRYNTDVYFNYQLTGGSHSDGGNRIKVAAGSTKKVWRTNFTNNYIEVYIDKLRFGKDDNSPYAKCGDKPGMNNSKKANSIDYQKKNKLTNEARALVRANKLDESIAKYNEAIKIDPSDEELKKERDEIVDFINEKKEEIKKAQQKEMQNNNNHYDYDNNTSSSNNNDYQYNYNQNNPNIDKSKEDLQKGFTNAAYALSQMEGPEADMEGSGWKFSFSLNKFHTLSLDYSIVGAWEFFYIHLAFGISTNLYRGWTRFDETRSIDNLDYYVYKYSDTTRYLFTIYNNEEFDVYEKKYTVGVGLGTSLGVGLRFKLNKNYALRFGVDGAYGISTSYGSNGGFSYGVELEIGNRIIGISYNQAYYDLVGAYASASTVIFRTKEDYEKLTTTRSVRYNNESYYYKLSNSSFGWDDNNIMNAPEYNFIEVSFTFKI